MEGLLNLEGFGIVDEGTVNTTEVRTLEVNILVASLLHARNGHKVVESLVVLHLAHTNHTGSVRQSVCSQITENASHIGKLVGILVFVPMIGTIGQEVIVVLVCIVACVEEVLQIVEGYGMKRLLPLCRAC